jgi:tetratricopeptide (TPR) repeat protein
MPEERVAIESNPRFTAYYKHAKVLKSKGNYEEARACYERAVALAQRDIAEDQRGFTEQDKERLAEQIEPFREIAEEAEGGGFFQYAASHLLAVMRLENFQNPQTFREYAEVLAKQGKLDEAEAFFEMALVLNPDDPESLFCFINFLKENFSESERATDELREKVVGLYLQNPEAWCAIAELTKDSGRYGEAISYYQRAVELDPDCTQAQEGLAELTTIVAGGGVEGGDAATVATAPADEEQEEQGDQGGGAQADDKPSDDLGEEVSSDDGISRNSINNLSNDYGRHSHEVSLLKIALEAQGYSDEEMQEIIDLYLKSLNEDDIFSDPAQEEAVWEEATTVSRYGFYEQHLKDIPLEPSPYPLEDEDPNLFIKKSVTPDNYSQSEVGKLFIGGEIGGENAFFNAFVEAGSS